MVMDELAISIDEQKNTIILANRYELTLDETTGYPVYGDHNLTEIVCVPTNSLEIVNDDIQLSTEHPTVGEEVIISFQVKNDGLLPSTGDQVTVEISQNGTVVETAMLQETGNENMIYVGETVDYAVTWVPESIEGDTTIKVTVEEKDVGGAPHIAEKTLTSGAEVVFGESYHWEYKETIIAVFEDIAFAIDAPDDASEWIRPESKAWMELVGQSEDEDVAQSHYYIFLPVENVGNEASQPFTLSAVLVKDSEMTETVLSEVSVPALEAKETRLVAVPLDIAPEYYSDFGALDVALTVAESNGTRLDHGQLHHTIYETGTAGYVLNDGKDTLSMKAGDKQALKVEQYPFKDESPVYYWSSDPSIATVDDLGNITAHKAGKATISAVGQKLNEATVEVNVTPGSKTSGGSGNGGGGEVAPVQPVLPQFKDVQSEDWFHDAVTRIAALGLVNGTGDDMFSPQAKVDRASFITMLWRKMGSPVVDYAMPFSDVAQETWYTEAVRWAASVGIGSGYDGRFDPHGEITREQAVTMLNRLCTFADEGDPLWNDMNILSYDDFGEISNWAIPAVQWAVGAGVIQGRTESTLCPQAAVLRCEVAKMLVNYIDAVEAHQKGK